MGKKTLSAPPLPQRTPRTSRRKVPDPVSVSTTKSAVPVPSLLSLDLPSPASRISKTTPPPSLLTLQGTLPAPAVTAAVERADSAVSPQPPVPSTSAAALPVTPSPPGFSLLPTPPSSGSVSVSVTPPVVPAPREATQTPVTTSDSSLVSAPRPLSQTLPSSSCKRPFAVPTPLLSVSLPPLASDTTSLDSRKRKKNRKAKERKKARHRSSQASAALSLPIPLVSPAARSATGSVPQVPVSTSANIVTTSVADSPTPVSVSSPVLTPTLIQLADTFPKYKPCGQDRRVTHSPVLPAAILDPLEAAFPSGAPALRHLCIICRQRPTGNIARHVCSAHLPWWWRPAFSCFFCRIALPQEKVIRKHQGSCSGPPSNPVLESQNRLRWMSSVEALLTFLARSLGLSNLPQLLTLVQNHRSLWGPPSGPMDPVTSLQIRQLEEYWQLRVSPTYSLTPPNSIACLGHWRIVANLLRSAPATVLAEVFNFPLLPQGLHPHFLPGVTQEVLRPLDFLDSAQSVSSSSTEPARPRISQETDDILPPDRLQLGPELVVDPGCSLNLRKGDPLPPGFYIGFDKKVHKRANPFDEDRPPSTSIHDKVIDMEVEERREEVITQTTTLVDAHFHLDEFHHRLRQAPSATDLGLHDCTFPFSACIPSYAFPRLWNLIAKLGEAPRVCQQFAMGWHPKSVEYFERPGFREIFAHRVRHGSCVAVGEIGFDFSRNPSDKVVILQEKVLEYALQHAKETDLPVVLHCRDHPSGKFIPPAWERLFTTLSATLDCSHKIYLHCFYGSPRLAGQWLERFPRTIFGYSSKAQATTNPEVNSAFQQLSLDRIVLESDSPCLPAQSGRSRPDVLIFLATYLSKLRDQPLRDVVRATTHTAKEFYNL